MTEDTAFASEARAKRIVLVGAAILLFAVVMGVLTVFRFVGQEEQRDLLAWQVRLGIVADSRATAVDDWLEQQVDVVRGLADNASLQLYMTMIGTAGSLPPDQQSDQAAEAGYLRNYLIDTAARTGFAVARPPEVAANVSLVGRAGLALTDPKGAILVATPNMPPMTPRLLAAEKQAGTSGRPAIVDLYKGPGGDPTMAFVTPVFAVQGDAGPSRAIGFVVGLRPVAAGLYKRLAQPGDTLATAETYLVRRDKAVVEYLSPLADGKPPLSRSLAADTPDLAAAFAIAHPGGFAVKRDYRGTSVLVTGRALSMVPWTVVRKVDRAEALGPADRQRTVQLVVLILVIVLLAGIILLVWRHGTSVRAARAAERFREEAERFESLSRFLEIVTDAQPTAIAAFDEQGRYTFANRGAAAGSGIDKTDLPGKSLASVLGPARARVLAAINQRVLTDRVPAVETLTFDDGDSPQIFRANHVPLATDGTDDGVLMTLEDVTDLMVERQRRETALRDLVRTLVGLVDRRDPYSANQSARVAEVAVAIAQEMEQPENVVRTVDIAGNLMNLGKILVPPELLTKTEALTDDERSRIRDSILASADLVETVHFDLPVAETLRQMQEQWDGQGYPAGLAGEAILVPARIVAVANAFVGMVSARAYRDAMPLSRACELLMDEADGKFDRRPVSALLNHVENRDGRARWSHFNEPPEVNGT